MACEESGHQFVTALLFVLQVCMRGSLVPTHTQIDTVGRLSHAVEQTMVQSCRTGSDRTNRQSFKSRADARNIIRRQPHVPYYRLHPGRAGLYSPSHARLRQSPRGVATDQRQRPEQPTWWSSAGQVVGWHVESHLTISDCTR